MFVIYSRVDSERITLSNVDNFHVEAIDAHRSMYFKEHDLKTISCVECGLKRVAAGRSDGFVYESLAGQRLIEAHQLDNLQAAIIKRAEVRFLLPIGPQGDATDHLITELIDHAVSSGQLKRKLQPAFEFYESLKP